jgi:tRNA-splicing endonuclease subunit Sen2
VKGGTDPFFSTTVYTPEELTALRRKERKAAKIERARLAVRAGQQLADGIIALGGELTEVEERAIEKAAESELKEEDKDESAYGKHIPGLIYLKPQEEEQQKLQDVTGEAPIEEDDEYIDVADMERLQLSGYETLYLAGMLGALEVVDEEVGMCFS